MLPLFFGLQELLRTERDRIDMEAEKSTLDHTLNEEKVTKGKLEQQMQDVIRSKKELNDTLQLCIIVRAAPSLNFDVKDPIIVCLWILVPTNEINIL